MASAVAPSIAELIELLAGQRQSLLQQGSGAAHDIEVKTSRLEQALAALALALQAEGGLAAALPQSPAAELARLRDELHANQATLVKLAAGNRRAVETLFGEASSYSR